MSEHSPTPWRIKDHGGFKEVLDANGKSIMGDIDYYPWVKSSVFPTIVRAVNSHEDLVSRLKIMANASHINETHCSLRGEMSHCHNPTCEENQKAISKAKGE